MADNKDRSLTAFMRNYAADRVVLDLDVARFKANHTNGYTPMIILRDRRFVVVINPMPLTDYFDVDVHSFVDGKDAAAAVMGMTTGRRVPGFRPEDTPLRSNGWPAANLVALFVGPQSHED